MTIEITGTGGIIEGNLGAANVNVNLDSSRDFDGNDDKIEVSATPRALVGNSNDFTISAWVKPAVGTISGTPYIVGAMESGAERFYLRIHDSQVKWGYGDTASAAAGAVSAGVWTHIALQYDVSDTEMKVFVNSQLKNTVSIAGKDITNTDNLFIGALNSNGSGANFFTGEIADVKIYNTEVSDADIAILASKIGQDPALTSAGTTNLKLWYKLGGTETTGSGNVPDDSPQSNTGTLTGASQKYDAYSVDVYDNSTTTDGTFTVTQGKVEGLALTSAEFDNATDYINLGNHNEFNFGNGSSDSPFTFAGWIRVDDATSGAIFSVYNEYAFGLNASDKLYLDLYDNADNVYERQSSTNTLTSYENEWVHVAATYSGVGGTSANAGINLYVNGVAIAMTAGDSGTYTAMHNLSNDAYIGYLYGAAGDAFDGEIGEFRIYDQELSAEQIASLYSKTLAFTPSHLYRLDEGSGPTANDTGTATTRNGTLINDTTWNNGTLDLDRGLEIAANGVMSAPRGTLKISLDTGTYVVRNISTVALPNNGSDAAVTGFAHNDGTVELGLGSYGHNQQIGDNASHSITFYNLDVLNSWYDTRGTVYVENVLDLTSYRLRLGVGTTAANYIIGKASATSQSTESKAGGLNTGGYITGGGGFSMGSSAVSSTIQGASTIYPAILNLNGSGGNNFAFGVAASQTAYQPTNSSYPLQLSNLELSDAWTTVDVGVPLYYKLTGDMKFAAVTLADEINLDLNGQRAEFGGDFDLTTGALSMNDSMAIFTGNIDFNGRIITSNTGSTIIHDPPHTSQRLVTSLYFGGNFFAKGVESEVTGYHWGGTSGSGEYPAKIFVGGEFDCNDKNVKTSTNWQVATGGDLRGRSGTLTAEGDFTTSGGLLGASALRFDGINDTVTIPISDSENDHIKGAFADGVFTVEGWIKMPTDFAGGVWVMKNVEFSVYIASDSATGWSLADGSSWSFASNPFTMPNLEDNKWHHLAFSRRNEAGNQGYYDIYVDGKLVVTHKVASAGLWTANDDDLFIGSYNGSGNFLGGGADDTFVENIRIWGTARTATQIRADMFNSTPTSSASDNIANFKFNEGTGTVITASDPNNASSNETAGTWNGSWAGAGTFTFGTCTLTMAKSGSQKIFTTAGEVIYALTVNAGSTTDIECVGSDSGSPFMPTHNVTINGTLSSTSVPLYMTNDFVSNGGAFAFGGSADLTGLNAIRCVHTSGTIEIPAVTTRFIRAEGNGGTTKATGNLTLTTELQVDTNSAFDANSKTITTKTLDLNGGTFTLGAGSLQLTGTGGSDGFDSVSTSVLNAGPGCTIGGDASGQKVNFISQNGFQIVGDIDDLNVTNEELTVVGTVSNCTGDIIQFTPGHDSTLSLETDTAEDRDIRLGGPSLDNANHLIAE